MTILGKVLVFFNLLLALVTGGLIVNAYVTRTNWRVGMEQALNEKKAAEAALKNEVANAASIRAQAANDVKKLQEDINRLKADIAGKEAEIASEKQRKAAADLLAGRASAVSAAATTEIERLQRERNQMADQLADLNKKFVKSTADLAEALNRENFNRLRAESLEKDLIATREELTTTKRRLEEALARLPSGRGGARENPPRVASIETSGQVTAVSGNLAQISIGSDNGIERGHILQVYRTAPSPLFLGTLTITHVRPQEAVGNFEPAAPGRTVGKGDSVDTRIIR